MTTPVVNLTLTPHTMRGMHILLAPLESIIIREPVLGAHYLAYFLGCTLDLFTVRWTSGGHCHNQVIHQLQAGIDRRDKMQNGSHGGKSKTVIRSPLQFEFNKHPRTGEMPQ